MGKQHSTTKGLILQLLLREQQVSRGTDGLQGSPASQYAIVPSVNSIVRNLVNPIAPTSISFNVVKTEGNGHQRHLVADKLKWHTLLMEHPILQ